ncbi:hypothetical protein VB10N_26530 [Vibrio sp. 10N]|nr:hypothetical protein VB10N_26530 [Vibrio sp. 10N]
MSTKMKKIITLTIVTALSSSALADGFYAGLDLKQGSVKPLNDRNLKSEIDVANINLGYEFQLEESNWSIAPEARIGFGIGDANNPGALIYIDGSMEPATNKTGLNNAFGFAVNAKYSFDNGFYLSVAPVVTHAEFKSKFTGDMTGNTINYSDSDTHIGAIAAAGYKFNDYFSLEANYEGYNDVNFMGLGIKAYF